MHQVIEPDEQPASKLGPIHVAAQNSTRASLLCSSGDALYRRAEGTRWEPDAGLSGVASTSWALLNSRSTSMHFPDRCYCNPGHDKGHARGGGSLHFDSQGAVRRARAVRRDACSMLLALQPLQPLQAPTCLIPDDHFAQAYSARALPLPCQRW